MKVKLKKFNQKKAKVKPIVFFNFSLLVILLLGVFNGLLGKVPDQIEFAPVALEHVYPDHHFEWFNPDDADYIAPLDIDLQLHHFAAVNKLDQVQINCLADAIYWEARGEPLKGQLAVGYVVLNRVANREHWPNTPCGVVYQKRSTGGGYHCQFSWVCEHGGKARRNERLYANSLNVARAVLDDIYPNPIGESTFFHSQAELSYKFAAYTPTATLGGHYFYRM